MMAITTSNSTKVKPPNRFMRRFIRTPIWEKGRTAVFSNTGIYRVLFHESTYFHPKLRLRHQWAIAR